MAKRTKHAQSAPCADIPDDVLLHILTYAGPSASVAVPFTWRGTAGSHFHTSKIMQEMWRQRCQARWGKYAGLPFEESLAIVTAEGQKTWSALSKAEPGTPEHTLYLNKYARSWCKLEVLASSASPIAGREAYDPTCPRPVSLGYTYMDYSGSRFWGRSRPEELVRIPLEPRVDPAPVDWCKFYMFRSVSRAGPSGPCTGTYPVLPGMQDGQMLVRRDPWRLFVAYALGCFSGTGLNSARWNIASQYLEAFPHPSASVDVAGGKTGRGGVYAADVLKPHDPASGTVLCRTAAGFLDLAWGCCWLNWPAAHTTVSSSSSSSSSSGAVAGGDSAVAKLDLAHDPTDLVGGNPSVRDAWRLYCHGLAPVGSEAPWLSQRTVPSLPSSSSSSSASASPALWCQVLAADKRADKCFLPLRRSAQKACQALQTVLQQGVAAGLPAGQAQVAAQSQVGASASVLSTAPNKAASKRSRQTESMEDQEESSLSTAAMTGRGTKKVRR